MPFARDAVKPKIRPTKSGNKRGLHRDQPFNKQLVLTAGSKPASCAGSSGTLLLPALTHFSRNRAGG
jgi:hypothetical protein